MSGPTHRLDVLYSGMLPRKLARRLIMVTTLQAFIDDSKTGERVLVLGGYLASHDDWRKLSIEWQILLNEFPQWDEFKMKRAARHPERAKRFYEVVQKYAPAYVACVVEIGPLRQLCDEFGLDDFFRNPYNYAFKAFMTGTLKTVSKTKEPFEIDFIFDERGEQKSIEDAWEFYRMGLSSEELSRLGARCRFEKSIDFAPLQTAEIVAWHARKHWLKYGRFDRDLELSWTVEKPIKGHIVHWDYEAMKPNMASLRDLSVQMPAIRRGQGIQVTTVTFSDVDLSDPDDRD
jgi:hypothetical protein